MLRGGFEWEAGKPSGSVPELGRDRVTGDKTSMGKQPR